MRDLLLDQATQSRQPNDFTTLDDISGRIGAFEARYNQRPVPFDWKFGRDDLDKFCHRLDAHRPAT